MTVELTQDDIDRGELCNSASCPVTRALKRALKCDVFVSVGTYWANVIHKGGKYDSYELPRSVRMFIRRFDDGQPVRPFRFQLKDFPCECSVSA